MQIFIQNQQDKADFTAQYEKIINDAVCASLDYLGYSDDFEISVVITDGDGIRELNKEFRGIDRATDVLSFPLNEFENYEMIRTPFFSIQLGDIVISLEKALCQAEEYGHSPKREIAFLTVHSMLHLLGYDHIKEEERKIMRAKEEEILKIIGEERK